MRTDPHEPGSRLPQLAKDEEAERLFDELNDILAAADLTLPARHPDPASLPLVYVVGAPRSGTTLVHQLLARHLDVGYVDNLVARFWRRPSVGIALSAAAHADRRRQIDLVSRHGTTAGPSGPHEFGYFWRHWLRLDESATHHLTPAEQDVVDAAGLGRALREEILGAFGRPAVFKNVICGFHAALLTRVHPRSLFVHARRDPIEVARSILHSRLERYGSYSTWWSLKPSTYPFEGLDGDPAAQAYRQAVDCRREIEDELARDGVHSLTVDYPEICWDPAALVRRVRDLLGELGCEVALAGTVPAGLEPSRGPTIPDELERALARAAQAS